MINIRINTALIGALLLATNMAYANPKDDSAKQKPKGSFSFTTDFSGAEVYGSGSHRYRMVLLDSWGKRPLANQDYALSNDQVDLPFVKESKKVFQGKTDDKGRTAVFAFKKAVPQSGWNLRPRVGSGPLGEQMVIKDSDGNPNVDFDYTLVVCEANDPYIYRGYTDVSGQTAYVATQTPANILVYITGDEPEGEKVCAK